ncbi:MAG: arsenate reductase ArsC [Flavobacteriales bacterium]
MPRLFYLRRFDDRSMKLLFVCIENSNRSQMAEAFARMHGSEGVEAYSAGSRPSGEVNPMAIRSMEEKGYDLSTHRSKGLEAIPPGPYDAVITMGCGEECPWIAAEEREEWSMPDPKPLEGEDLDRVRDMIEQEVLELMEGLEKEKGP